MTKIQTVDDLIEELLGDITYRHPKGIYPFFVRVGCIKMAAPRHERFEFIREMGYADIDRVFNGQSFHKSVLTFVFPERHMSVHEQHAFMYKLAKHPHVDEIERVDILTSSPLLLTNFMAKSIRILTWDDDFKYNGEIKW